MQRQAYSRSDRTTLCEVCVSAGRATYKQAHLSHRLLRYYCCRGFLVRVEKLQGDSEHAELVMQSEDAVFLYRYMWIEAVQSRVQSLWRQRYMRQAAVAADMRAHE